MVDLVVVKCLSWKYFFSAVNFGKNYPGKFFGKWEFPKHFVRENNFPGREFRFSGFFIPKLTALVFFQIFHGKSAMTKSIKEILTRLYVLNILRCFAI